MNYLINDKGFARVCYIYTYCFKNFLHHIFLPVIWCLIQAHIQYNGLKDEIFPVDFVYSYYIIVYTKRQKKKLTMTMKDNFLLFPTDNTEESI